MKTFLLSHLRLFFVIVFAFFVNACARHHAMEHKTETPPAEKQSVKPTSPTPIIRGVLLPLSGKHRAQAETIKNGMLWGCTQELPASTCQIRFYDTDKTSLSDAYQQALNDHADVILGPLTKENVDAILNTSTQVPVIALNQHTQKSRTLPDRFYEISLSPEDDLIALLDKAEQLHAERALIIMNDNPHSKRLHRLFVEKWLASQRTITETFTFTRNTSFPEAIPTLLHSHPAQSIARNDKRDNSAPINESGRRHDFDVIILFSTPEEAEAIVPALRYSNVLSTPILASSSVYSGNVSSLDLASVTICDVDWPKLHSLSIPKDKQTRLFALGRDAVVLSERLPALASGEAISLWIGRVKLNEQREIIRTPRCQKIRSGEGASL